MIVFGPIPSRRLGRSLGINNIPPKECSYSCIYCQVGLTDTMSIIRKEYYPTHRIFKEVSERVKTLLNNGEKIDYITFVPDGEPTLDRNLGNEIDLLKSLGINIAVITNSSLLDDETVRADLIRADWVSVKIDSVDETMWHKINRPSGKLNLQKILSGIEAFSKEYEGVLVTETMLVKGINDEIESIEGTAKFIKGINPHKSYILIPVRPPAEEFVEVPDAVKLNLAHLAFCTLINDVELLTYSEETDFSYSFDVEKELLSIMAVHPMRKDAVEKFLNKANSGWSLVEKLINNNTLREVKYSGNTFFMKNIRLNTKKNILRK